MYLQIVIGCGDVFAKVKGRGGHSAILVFLLVTVFAFAFVFVNVFFFIPNLHIGAISFFRFF